jgi:hypothetical protein
MWGRRKVSIDWEWKPKIQKQKQRGDNFLCKEDRFRFLVGVFMVPLFYFPYCSPLILSKNLPSFCMCCRHLFIDKVTLSSNTLVLNFLGFMVFFLYKFWFFCILKTSNINIDSMRKINNFKNWRVKSRTRSKNLWKLNYFETTLKIIKTMQIYYECIFFLVFVVFCYFWFFSEIY